MSAVYDIFEEKIYAIGALAVNTHSWFAEKLMKYGLYGGRFEQLIRGELRRVSVHERKNGIRDITYKGDGIGRYTLCSFEWEHMIETRNPEIQQYIDWIREYPEKIMEGCGIRLIRFPNGLIMATASFERNVRTFIKRDM